MVAVEGLDDRERFPAVSDDGLRFLDRLRQHPHAPRYNLRTGDRLTTDAVARVKAYEERQHRTEPRWTYQDPPDWLADWIDRCLTLVPVYRSRGAKGSRLEDISTVSRADLAAAPWSFVPDDVDLSDLMVYYTSGTTGKPVHVLSHPEASAKKLALYRKAARAHGTDFDGVPGRVAIAFVCAQKSTLTYATISTYLSEAGVVKINLNPAEWNDPADAARFLDDIDPEICTGDPVSFAAMADLPVHIRPKALVSSAMAVLPATRKRLEERFGCPVVDVYSLCETGPIACARGDVYPILPDDIIVEILDPSGRRCEPGETGEITITGGRNPFLPLLRFRTGDTAALDWIDGHPVLTQLMGRSPVIFVRPDGGLVNNIDVATVLRPYPIVQFALHQHADHSLRLGLRGGNSAHEEIRRAMLDLFGAGATLTIEPIPADEWKVVPYSSDVPHA
jgi:phenylacetate-CoA ligase